jgi:hypothetical protein
MDGEAKLYVACAYCRELVAVRTVHVREEDLPPGWCLREGLAFCSPAHLIAAAEVEHSRTG